MLSPLLEWRKRLGKLHVATIFSSLIFLPPTWRRTRTRIKGGSFFWARSCFNLRYLYVCVYVRVCPMDLCY